MMSRPVPPKTALALPVPRAQPRHRATMDAGRFAGQSVLDILNEPTVVAIAYGYQSGILDRSGQAAGANQAQGCSAKEPKRSRRV